MTTQRVMKTLFLQPPSFDGFDGGAGSRFQARREVRSFWYPTWLAQPAALVPGSKLIDAPPAGYDLKQVLEMAQGYELIVLHTSEPSFISDVKVAEALKQAMPDAVIGFVGAKAAVAAEEVLNASPAIDFAAREEFDFTIKELAECRPMAGIDGLSFKDEDGKIVHNKPRAILENMDELPFVSTVYKRDLRVEDYYSGYLQHPYVSFYTGRGCHSRCTFCLWPQTVGGHRYRTRSVENVLEEVRQIVRDFPQVKEIFFDDDTFTDDRERAVEIAKGMGEIGVTWSCNAKVNVPYDVLKAMKENGLRLLLVGYESGNQQILNNTKKGMKVETAHRFTRDCHKLGIVIHGTFILGLPGETKETIEETIRFACDINPHSLQVSLAAPYPGTELYQQAIEEGWITSEDEHLVKDNVGTQQSVLSYPHLNHTEIFKSSEDFYKRFYFRSGKIAEMVGEMIRRPSMIPLRLREGVEFVSHFGRR